MCDGDSDCEDNSDEDNCEALVCKLSHHVCANDSTICLPSEKLCDGKDDCPDGSDEKLCGREATVPRLCFSTESTIKPIKTLHLKIMASVV